MIEALPAVTEPSFCLKLGLSFLNFAASNYEERQKQIKSTEASIEKSDLKSTFN